MTLPEPVPSSPASRTAPRKKEKGKPKTNSGSCARWRRGPDSRARRERIANWDIRRLDWSEVIRLAEHHGVLPLVAHTLIESGSRKMVPENARELPPEIERSLRSAYEANLRRSLWFTAELARIMQHFERRELRALPYKGPVLAQSLYHDQALRSFSDLDFLISPADFERAKQTLGRNRISPLCRYAPAVERFWLRTGYERSFDGAAGANLVELQWALLPHFYAVDLPVEDLLARAGPHRRRRVRGAVPVSRRFAAGAVPPRRQASLDAADLAGGHCGDFAISIAAHDCRLRDVIFSRARAGNHSHSRREFLAGKECASRGASPSSGRNHGGRFSGGRSGN